ncbi:SDR family oxidoreductase [Paucimonas lemoignei]|uniref:SDR family oxidoreductase n=1 Tax=Paucimonas lemoignei TaxID=29443 RepID=UPI0010512699|nr:SDR family oxidoreductase [Paucimonas lemoignei]
MSSAASAQGSARSGSLAGKNVFVTGGGSGLGAALCQVLTGAGATVVVGDIRQENAERIAGLLREEGAQVHAMACDVGDPESARQAIDNAISACGRLDVLINNAGTDITCSIDELEYGDWDRVIHTNLYGPFLMSKYAARHMREQKGGAIVNIASTAARRAWPNASAYHASKWGVLGLSHALHAELRPHNIKVTAVIAGGMRTPFLLDRFPDIDISTLQDPRNVAEAVLSVLQLPAETVIPEIMVLPMKESSWP